MRARPIPDRMLILNVPVAWLVTKTFTCLVLSQIMLMLGLPTLADPGSSHTQYIRLARKLLGTSTRPTLSLTLRRCAPV